MTDGELIRIARQLDALNQKIRDLVSQIEQSDRPDAAEIVESLDSNGFYNPALAQAVISSYVDANKYGKAFGGHIFSKRTAAGDIVLTECGEYRHRFEHRLNHPAQPLES